jgi:tetratricopeptide (TPR) repeat protein
MVLMLNWLSSTVMGPRVSAKRALQRGRLAFGRKNYADARLHLRQAARYEPLREEAVCLMAEAALLGGRPDEALHALNSLLLENDELGRKRSPRVRLLRGIAGCILGRPAAARRELAAIPRAKASIDELLAATQACILCGDSAGSLQLLDALGTHSLGGALAARVQLCRAALHHRAGDWQSALNALPDDSDCSPPDAIVCQNIRAELLERFAAVPAR